MKVVGVIGAGASGLCATRHILASDELTPIVWEQSSQIGGTWRVSKDVGTDSRGFPVHSSMYESLRTDLPKLIMKFPDFEFPSTVESFAHHTAVLKYLEDYADHFKLHPYIKLGHHVENVAVVESDEGPPSWAVTVKDLSTGVVSTVTCDALLICNGHFSTPQKPHIEGIEDFKGQQIHSHDYREPSPYTDSKVIILGAGASGLDILMEVSTVAKEVLLSHNLPVPFPSEFPPNVKQGSGIVKAVENGFYLKDGSFQEADALLYCTGYKYTFPFLEDKCGITVENNHVEPLYKQIINASFPTMGFIGLPSRIIAFPLFNYQVQYFLATLTGKTPLPRTAEMKSEIEAYAGERKNQGWKESQYHILQNDQFQYMEDLATLAGVELPSPHLKKIWGVVIPRLFFSFPIFKSYEYALGEDGALVEKWEGKVVSTSWDLTILTAKQTFRLLWRNFPKVTYILGSAILRKLKGFVGL